jgi:ribosome maturation factor RimP
LYTYRRIIKVMESTTDILRARIRPLVEEEDLELVELNFFEGGSSSVLRIYVDKAGGVTLGECASLNRKIGDYLETEDLISRRYLLEVSSPGLDRPLTGVGDFKRKIGETVKLILKEKVPGPTEVIGRIKNLKDDNLILEIEPEKFKPNEAAEKIIPLNQIAWAKIVF